MPRILFAGSPAIAVPSLRTLVKAARDGAPWTFAGVLTNPDRARGRSGRPEPSEVGAAAEELGIPLIKAENLKAGAREAAAALKPDLLVSFAYGRIFGPKFLSLFPLGGINIHPSLLPKYRGASPIQEAILNRDRETGISVQRIAPEMDTGDILAFEEIPLSGRETSETLSDAVGLAGARLLAEVLTRTAERGSLPEGRPQRGTPSYCSLIEKDSGLIEWNKSAEEIDALIRAYTPWPLARTSWKGQALNILDAAPYDAIPAAPGVSPEDNGSLAGNETGTFAGRVLGTDKKYGILIQTGGGILAVSRLQFAARKALFWRDFLNGTRDFTGSKLGGAVEDR